MASHSYTSSPRAEGKGFPCSNTQHPLLFTQETGYLFLKTCFLLFCVAAHLHQLRELRAHGLECILCRLWLLLHEVTEEPKAEIRGVGREVSTWVGKASCLTGLDPRTILHGPYPMLSCFHTLQLKILKRDMMTSWYTQCSSLASSFTSIFPPFYLLNIKVTWL